MDNFIFSVNATVPIFLVIILGYVLKKLGIINKAFVDTGNKYVFKVALPVMLFKDLAFSNIIEEINGSFIVFCIVVTIVMFLVSWFLSYLFLKDKTMVGAFAQASVRSSAAILGVAFVENICGNAGMAPLMIASAVPFFNVLSVVILTFSADYTNDREESAEKDKNRIRNEVIKSLKGIATNPIIIGILLGLLFAASRLDMPVIPRKTIDLVAVTATPVALLAIGGGFEFKLALTRIRPAVAASIIKLILLPLIFLPIAVISGFRSSELVAILIMLASPSTVSCFIMAKGMGNDEVLTSNIVVLTTIFSSVTLTLWIFLLRNFALI
ncbi:MAG: AEC family transporter [Eubacterium sp.]|nr:AEC family transporter [Eubacterium sp.]